MNICRIERSRTAWCLLVAAGAVLGSTSAVAVERAGAADAARYQRERAVCMSGQSNQDRATCLRDISPVPAILGWDTIDEVDARRLGWTTRSLALDGPPTLHLRPPGAHDGVARGYRRWGECAWAYGAHPLNVVAGGVHRMQRPPYVLGGLHYLAGYGLAAARGVPRAPAPVRAFCRAEQRARARRALATRIGVA